MSRSRSSSNRQWNAYSPPDPEGDGGSGSRGQASFFYYNPDGSSQSQWWYNTFAEGQEQPPLGEYNNPYAGHVGYHQAYDYTPGTSNFDQKYREYRPLQVTSSPPHPRSRTVTPPPPQSPSPEYLATSELPSHQISDPSSSRKLLVLDLNGTLLHRSPHNTRPKSRNKRHSGNGEEVTPLNHSGQRLRPVHPRPYMPSFRAYIFHPQTKAWLDVMIWSSAQPHSVADMVDKCFTEFKAHLIAVWARDTLGLSAQHYHRKVQTTKDLNVPWNQLFSLPPSDDLNPASPGQPTALHSAMTTILMDDSPRKAELQPYNHLCIKEYDADIRNKDLVMFQAEKHRPAPLSPIETPAPIPPPPLMNISIPINQQHVLFQPDGSMGIQPDATLLQSTSSMLSHDNIPGFIFSDPLKQQEQSLALMHEEMQSKASKKRKRKGKKRTLSPSDAEPAEDIVIKFDETLLAIVGIMDEIKIQSNVSGWVKAGGLWGPFPPPVATSNSMIIASIRDTNGSDGSVDDGHGEEKRQRVEAVNMAEQQMLNPSGNDAVASPVRDQADKQGETLMWFGHPPTMDHWVSRGRIALQNLGIPILHGLER